MFGVFRGSLFKDKSFDRHVRLPEEHPTIGLFLCKEKTVVWSLTVFLNSLPVCPRSLSCFTPSTPAIRVLPTSCSHWFTANGLAADLKRHLDNELVVAPPPSAAYRLQKAFRRNKLVFTAGAAVSLALVIGVAISTWQVIEASRARQQEARANAQLRAQVEVTEHAKQAAEMAARAESQQRVRSEELVQAMQFQKADELLASGPSVPGMTLLGQLVRANPSNAVFASRFTSALLVASRPQLTAPIRHEGVVRSVSFSPDGQQVVLVSGNGARVGRALRPAGHRTKRS